MKVTNVQPGVVHTAMVEGAAADMARVYGMEANIVEMGKDRMLQPEDVGQVVWEVVSRPARCYQVEVLINDTMQSAGGGK